MHQAFACVLHVYDSLKRVVAEVEFIQVNHEDVLHSKKIGGVQLKDP